MAPFLDVIRALNEAGAEYVVVGGVAVILHGHARLTTDLDVILKMDEENILKAVGAISGLGYKPRVPVEAEELADAAKRRRWVEEKNMKVFSFVHPAKPILAVDVLMSPPIEPGELMDRCVRMPVGGVEVRACGRADLIALKRLSGRPLDLTDIEALEDAK